MVRPILSDADRADAFRGVAHPTRRRVLKALDGGERTIRELRQGLKLSLPALSQHLRVLREAGLISHRVEGKRRWYRKNTAQLQRIKRWVDQSV
ncbi:MAG: winged helix-turn-helix transcriptional regulator [Phycisphaeraceae bacterium]|nr:winged helix-turn-helix transcriptional regulator [Phycisphaeraceae bacterium]